MSNERQQLMPARRRRGLGDRMRGLAEALSFRSEPTVGYTRSTQVPVSVATRDRLQRFTGSHNQI